MEQIVNTILEWITANPHWAGLAVFAIAFLESLAIVGLAMPGWLLLVGIGSLIGTGNLNFWWMSLASFIGASLGQLISYWVGFHYQDRVRHWSWIERHQKLLTKAENFFKKHGFAGILTGQFIGPIRAVISLIAGVLNMPAKNFLLAVFIATLIWAPVYLMPGVIIGAALTFEQSQMWILIASVLSLVISLWLLGRFAYDYFNRDKTNINISYKRKVIAAVMVIILIGVATFLSISSYGYLMLELIDKIWRVIS